jgi:hypothetical protein
MLAARRRDASGADTSAPPIMIAFLLFQRACIQSFLRADP